jgi:hypothetical protein
VTAHIISLTEDSTWAIPNSILWEPEIGMSNVSNQTLQEQLDQSVPSDITEIKDSVEPQQTSSWSSSRMCRGETLQDGIFVAETNRLDAGAEKETEQSDLQLPELFTQSSNNDIKSALKPQKSSKTSSSSLPSVFEEEQFPSQSVEPLSEPSVANLDQSKYINPLFGDNLPTSSPSNPENSQDSDREKSQESELDNTDVEISHGSKIRRVQSNKISSVFSKVENNKESESTNSQKNL